MPAERLKTFLDDNGVRYQTLAHRSACTSQGVAAALHVDGRDVAKTVVLKVDGQYALAVLPAPCAVDLRCFRAEAGAWSVALAPESDLARLFPGCEVGAEPPFGNLYGLPVWVDEKLTQDPKIFFNAGSHTEAVRMEYRDFERLVHPRVARFARP